MTDKNQVYKKIVWTLTQTKAELEAFQHEEEIDSPLTEIMLVDNLTKWFLRFYPRGFTEEDKDQASLYLCLDEATSREFQTKFTLGVVGTKGNKEHNIEYPAKSFNVGYGCSDLLKQDELFNLDRGYFTDGKLTLYCKLTLSDDVTASDGLPLLKQNVCSDLKRMLDEEIFTDFEVQTSDKKVLKVHKNILSARSPFFLGMLTSGMKETQENVVKLPEKAVVMTAALSFIYSGGVDNLKVIADELVLVAQKYQLNELKKLCIESIIENLSCDNAVKMLLATEGLTDAEELKKKCIDVVASNFEFLSTTAEWEEIPLSLVPDIIRQSNSEINDTINV